MKCSISSLFFVFVFSCASAEAADYNLHLVQVPGADLKEEHVGVEWYVSAVGPSNRPAFWPKGYPSVVSSASIVPQAEKKGIGSDQDSR